MRLFLVVAILYSALGRVQSVSAETAAVGLFAEGNGFYRQGSYDSAREKYLAAIETGVRDSRLFYNLGNACFNSGRLGEAIVWYERARRLSPRDEDIAANLQFASYLRKDRVEGEEEVNPLWRLALAVYRLPTEDELAGLFSCSFFALFGLAAWRLGRSDRRQGKPWLACFVTSSLVAVATVVLLIARLQDTGTDIAVVTVEEAVARSGPGLDQTVVFRIHEGTEMRLHRRESEWLLIRLKNGLGGWMRASDVTVI
jgi:tetratricopeptide (TPR) repeat protein